MGAKKIIVKADYLPELDRMPPRPAPGCGRGLLVVMLAFGACGIVALIAVVSGIFNAKSPEIVAEATSSLEPSETATEGVSITVDAWSLTGTAMFYATITPTVDYCWWLTPTPTFTPTLPYTPDAWQATGTAIYLETNPAKEATATPDFPHAWCNNIPTLTPTLTPLSLSGLATDVPATPTLTPTITPLMLPTRNQNNNNGIIQITPPDSPTVAPVWTAIPTLPLPTLAPTKKPKKTKTPTPTATFTATDTVTASYTPTETATFTPTATPDIQSVLTNCDKHYPEFVVQNFGMDAWYVDWSIIHQDTGFYANMGTIEYIPAGFSFLMNAPNATGTGGTFGLYLSSDVVEQVTPAPSASVFCEYPTATPTETATEPPTETPTLEVTP